MDTNARLSANLQRAYTNYKTTGSTPVYHNDVPQTALFPVASESAPCVSKTVHENEKQALVLPDITRPQSSYPLPPPLVRYERTNTAQRLSQPDLRASDGGADITYEYQVDDAAGIPSLGFFRKSYSLPTNRYGRVGACWRHIQQCTAQGGSNLLYVDGHVKSNDCSKYPPFGIVKSKTMINYLGQRLVPKAKGQTTFNSKAKDGFEYWYKEPRANITEPPAAPVRTISGHQFKIKGR